MFKLVLHRVNRKLYNPLLVAEGVFVNTTPFRLYKYQVTFIDFDYYCFQVKYGIPVGSNCAPLLVDLF